MAKVLLVSMPWMTPNISSIALGTLRPILEAAGIETDTLYGSVLFPRTGADNGFLERHGQFLFAPYMEPGRELEPLIDGVLARIFDDFNRNCFSTGSLTWADLGFEEAGVREMVRTEIEHAGVCLDRCFERAMAEDYDVIGFSLTFETQVPAALALARRLREARPGVKLVLGGAACAGEQADGLLTSFRVLDVVCHSEGEDVIVPLVQALSGQGRLEDVRGIVYRDASGQVVHNPPPPLIGDLDRVPRPSYGDFVQQIQRSEWADLPLKLFFETSRGCWWGQKHLCTFCGLNGEGLVFRAKTGQRAFEEIRDLYQGAPAGALLQATDNILHVKYFETLLPKLALMPRIADKPLKIFFEVKSNMRPEQVALMAAAGFDGAQPGIESFHDEVLALMDKGCTGLNQVQFIKWMDQERITPIYNILFGSPGEQASWYHEMLELLPFLTHLSPPVGVTQLELMRFSPYFERPDSFGITNIRPKAYYADLYREPGVDVMRMSYEFDFDHPIKQDRVLEAAHRQFSMEIARWQRDFKLGRLFYADRGDHLVIVDRRDSGAEHVEVLSGAAADVYRYLDTARPFAHITRRFPELDPSFVRGLLERWRHRRWAYGSPSDHHIAVIPRHYEQVRDVAAIVAAAAPRKEAGRPPQPRVGPVRLAVVAPG
ncbi:MAG: RiPP maturation radical SAM C-methyltransferase [Deltaproteobacteria bacterium]|nr:RiPP maturation radical SAM C-methyltransferase [Deltaproteobacteria bacterium]